MAPPAPAAGDKPPWQQGKHLTALGSKEDPHHMGTRGLGKIDPGLSEARDEFLTSKTQEGDPLRCLMPCAVESAHSSDKLPSHSLRSCSGPAGL
jgi:hypothetical protein